MQENHSHMQVCLVGEELYWAKLVSIDVIVTVVNSITVLNQMVYLVEIICIGFVLLILSTNSIIEKYISEGVTKALGFNYIILIMKWMV